jgi:hypothetical protein
MAGSNPVHQGGKNICVWMRKMPPFAKYFLGIVLEKFTALLKVRDLDLQLRIARSTLRERK